MKDRLIELLRAEMPTECDKHENCIGCLYEFDEESCIASLAAATADHLLANGVIVPPVKVGDVVFCFDDIREGEATEILPLVVKFVHIGESGYCFYAKGNSWVAILSSNDFGKTVFLTREEAEQALKEREQE